MVRVTGLLARLRTWARALKLEAFALALTAGDPRTPWYAKLAAAAVVAYALSPIDLIPDFIPVLGHIDDLILVPLGIALAVRLVPPEVLRECRQRAAAAAAQASAEAGRRRSWIGAAVIVLIWLAVAAAGAALVRAWGRA